MRPVSWLGIALACAAGCGQEDRGGHRLGRHHRRVALHLEQAAKHDRCSHCQSPEVIRHGSPWPDAKFVWVKDTIEVTPGLFLIPVVSDVSGTRELREITVALRTEGGLVLIAGCSHPGIEKILEASRTVEERVWCIFGGLHLVLTKEPEVQRIARALRDQWRVERIAPGHCTGEPGFAALQEVFGENYLFAGLGESVRLP